MAKIFITGTDTEVGKTYVTTGLLKALNEKSFKTIGIKPVATGAYYKNHKLYNDDALSLQRAASIYLDYQYINPFVYEKPMAPHLCAYEQNELLTVNRLNEKLAYALEQEADYHLIEGVGGFLVPLNEKETMADFVKINQFEVLLVVDMRLGCLNHALLTYAAIKASDSHCLGWLANCLTKREEKNALISTLKNLLPIPCLGIIQYGDKIDQVLAINKIIKTS